jgi:hypothetical protein
MKHAASDRVLHGAAGGALAGIVVIVWFFAMDVVAGTPFDTPARLSSAVLREGFSRPWPRLIALFTVLHFGVFVSLGVATTWSLDAVQLKPNVIVGAVFGVFVLNAVHYVGLLVTGTNLLTVVPVLQVTVANLLGGVLMMFYLQRTLGDSPEPDRSAVERHPLLVHGLVTGAIGAVAVAMWFLAVDLFAGSPLRTPAVLGSALLLGSESAADVQLNPSVIAAYSVLHLGVFAAVGIAFSWLGGRVESTPAFGARAAGVLVLLEVLFLGTAGMASDWVLQELGWLTVLVANVLAVGAMGAWIWRSRPGGWGSARFDGPPGSAR